MKGVRAGTPCPDPRCGEPGLCGTERGPGPRQSCDVSIETPREIVEKHISPGARGQRAPPAWAPGAAAAPGLVGSRYMSAVIFLEPGYVPGVYWGDFFASLVT